MIVSIAFLFRGPPYDGCRPIVQAVKRWLASCKTTQHPRADDPRIAAALSAREAWDVVHHLVPGWGVSFQKGALRAWVCVLRKRSDGDYSATAPRGVCCQAPLLAYRQCHILLSRNPGQGVAESVHSSRVRGCLSLLAVVPTVAPRDALTDVEAGSCILRQLGFGLCHFRSHCVDDARGSGKWVR